MTHVGGRHSLAIVDSTLSGEMPPMAMGHDSSPQSVRRVENVAPNQIGIDNFAFNPTPRTVSAGTEVTWINRDDVPHIIVDTKGTFSSRVLDEPTVLASLRDRGDIQLLLLHSSKDDRYGGGHLRHSVPRAQRSAH